MTVAAEQTYDLVGIGIGPFNLALAALADRVPGLRTAFFDAKPEFSWHPGLMFPDARLQVPFLADLVTMVDPTSPWSFLNYLRAHDRLFPFYFSERFHVPRTEYNHYCGWVSRSLSSCHFGTRVTGVAWNAGANAFQVTYLSDEGEQAVAARHLVLGVGTRPVVPEPFQSVEGQRVFHAADYLTRRASLAPVSDITVLGSGQTGAEVFLDLLRAQPEQGRRLRWLTRSPAFAPMEYSKLGLEHFTPDYTRYFRSLTGPVRDRLVPAQWQLYKAISADTIAEIHDLLYERSVGGGWPDVHLMPGVAVTRARDLGGAGLELSCHQREQQREFSTRTDAVVLATGFTACRPDFLRPIENLIEWDAAGRYQVDEHYRVILAEQVVGRLHVQNAELHTHGVGTPDLGLGAYRAAVILNAVTERSTYPLPRRTAFTTFGAHDDGAPTSPSSTGIATPLTTAPLPVTTTPHLATEVAHEHARTR
ncbi:lysine N(6)-hydroxylase/L-ornithine N(5)-oxygenase family protein [Actinopolymorpha alba]|uniref:lysine N(6)-hydroxylase/L-ornithine N(5)-oxygenase family protein n=1 Tax=Actinopolymorpha alba TaxID=533267 RepID=UPI0003661239|nr:lysine N(6)-hydroxylase/L-ornithine N(5)-oxygenase family protein [Actinopolymorpha alba]